MTAADIIKAALRRINSFQSGEAISSLDAADCLEALNDLLDSWSTDQMFVFGSNEWVMSWSAGKRLYSVGNPTNAQLSGSAPVSLGVTNAAVTFPNNGPGNTWPNIVGTITGGSPTITGVTNMPSNLVAGTSNVFTPGVGSTLTDSQNCIPINTTVTAFNAGAQTITMSANATSSSIGLDSIAYTIPGDFPIPRPLRITHGFTRFNQLDFTLDVCATESQYTSVLYKAQPGPWPTIAWYNNTYPYGLLNAYQQPGNSAELHLHCDTVLNTLTLNQPVSVPQGYARALKWNLAREICAEYGFPLSQEIKVNAQESLAMIKALNANPAQVSRYDRALSRGNRGDGGWIMTGGYGG
jgi:hypothetical protein